MTVQPEVRALEGYPVVLPCTFSHPQHSQHTSLQLLWRLGHGQGASVLFRCTSRTGAPSCEPGPQQDQRYRLEGNPREHDLSLRINSAALQDSGRYYCRVEVQGRDHVSFEDKIGTRLRVEAVSCLVCLVLLALVSLVSSSSFYGGLVPVPGVLDFPVPPSCGPAPPKILSLWAEGSEQSGFTALCRVQGSPPPDVQWLGTEGSMLEGAMLEGAMLEGSHPLAQGSRECFQTVSQLRDVSPGQQYTCSASNPLGKDQAVLYVLPPRPHVGGASTPLLLLLSLPLGAKVLLLLLLGGVWAVHGVRCWRK
ncbi:sialic acid-binding Ig-like lectin 15 isoform X1 [Notothenia coriiceps]|uniref:Sialic acid-binding Ig-like lectin 15 isoform X1 n=1 Tax=Notothenia coriiceps TaxID=8208 RepID=A0A6I9NTA3_9TELE|nr:PREDICTED: sialic acid-binding Ig-like lectin 15 isoform X1 [Notothenia coriiceps]